MIAFFRNRIFIAICLFILLAVNVFLLYNRKKVTDKRFASPVSIGTALNYVWTKNGKEICFVFVKPTCATCALFKDSINNLSDKYSNVLQFTGLYNPKYYDAEYFKTYRFRSYPINSEMRNALHLAFTPQFVLVENDKVTFVCNFNLEFSNEFTRLKQYLKEKYAE